MRKSIRRNATFIDRLVNDTRELVLGSKSSYEKVAQLRFLAALQQDQICKLLERTPLSHNNRLRTRRIQLAIRARERAFAYLQSTADYVTRQSLKGSSLKHMPRMFAVPKWEGKHVLDPGVTHPPSETIPFMEFSS